MVDIEFKQVNKTFDNGVHAVRDFNLHVEDGEMIVLVGPSGCGKSTLLRMVAGLETESSGEIRIGGTNVSPFPPERRDVAMVFQNYALYPHMTVRKNLAFPLKMMKFDREEIRRRVEQTADLLELTAYLDSKPGQLSGGQRQRVAMGRALVREPDVFLLDEPLSNLDAKLRVQMRSEITNLQKRLGTTTVYVTHDQVEAMTMGDRLAVLREGELQQAGRPQEIYNRPDNVFTGTFIGSPSMSLVWSHIRRNEAGQLGFELGGTHMAFPEDNAVRERFEPHENEERVVGIRPEMFVPGDAVPENRRLDVTVSHAEEMGHECIVYFQVESLPLPKAIRTQQASSSITAGNENDATETAFGNTVMVARLPSALRLRRGEESQLGIDTAACLLFDGQGRAVNSTC